MSKQWDCNKQTNNKQKAEHRKNKDKTNQRRQKRNKAFTPNVAFGSNISPNISEFSWIDVQAGNYFTFDIWLTAQNFNQIQARDPNVIFQLLIKSKGE
jgi:hypothetical protein